MPRFAGPPGAAARPGRPLVLLLGLLLASALVATGCIFGREGERDLSSFFEPPDEAQAADPAAAAAAPAEDAAPETPSTEDLLDLSVAPQTALEAVQKFFAQIAAARFEDAYRLVSLEVRELITREQFAERYRDIWAEATIQGVEVEVVPPRSANPAGVEVILHYDTVFFGAFEERVFAPTRRQPNWVVDWSPDLIFEGLSPRGYLVHRFVDVPERGDILDRNGVPLATKGEIAIIGVSHDLITDEDLVIEAFVNNLQLDEQQVRDLVFQDVPSYFFIPIVRLPFDTERRLIAVFEQLAEIGILIQRETRRVYPERTLAAHVVGFLAEINEEELVALAPYGYQSGDFVGRDGVEAIFEEALAGRRGGRLAIIAPDGRIVREMVAIEMTPAADVWLAIDVRVQRLAEAALGEQAGAIVAMDPRSGEVLALVSYPRFDPNAFVRGLTEEEFEQYFEDPLQPFLSRATEQLYPPGSTFKVVTMAAGIEALGLQASSRLDCPALWDGLGPDVVKTNWKEVDRGLISLTQAIAESCNTVFYELGQRLHEQDEATLSAFSAGFGFGRPTGVIGVREEAGVNPGPEWKRLERNDFWYTGDTINLSIGQGFLAATPLQITNAYAALATDGILLTPLVAGSLRTPDGEIIETFSAAPTGVLPVSADTLADLRWATRRVITSPVGTGAYPFRGSPLAVAGKSGTAEDRDEQSHALFVAYANFNDPSLIVTVVLDDGESGADEAGPLARQVLERTILAGWVR